MCKRLITALFLFVCVPATFLWPAAAHAKKQEDVLVYINLWQRRLYVKTGSGDVLASYPIAPGAKDTPSPVGSFRITRKERNWGGGFGTRWLELDVRWGTYGIHGTNRPEYIGRYVSHGCFRMKNRDIEHVYKLVSVGTPVLIDGPIMGHEDLTYRILVPGSRGALVQLVQNRLRAGGYYTGPCDGRFDSGTERAVKLFQKEEGLTVTGQIHLVDLQHLGIVE